MRSGAAGTHYTSSGTLPMIPGVDGAARQDGTRLLRRRRRRHRDDGGQGMVDARRSVVLPTDVERVWTEPESPRCARCSCRRKVRAGRTPTLPSSAANFQYDLEGQFFVDRSARR